MIRKILNILNRKEKSRLGLLMLLDIFISVADIVFLALLLLVINHYTDPGKAGRLSSLIPWPAGVNSLLLISAFFFLFSLKNFFGFLIYRAQCKYLLRVASRLSRDRLLNYLEGHYTDYIDQDSSVHIREISYHPLDFCQHVLGGIQQIVTQTLLILLAITGIVLFNATLFFLLFSILLPPVFAIFYFIKKKLRSVRANTRSSSERSLQYLQEALSGFIESNIYHRNEVFLDRYFTYQQEFNKSISDQLIMQGIPNRMVEIFALFGIVLLIGINSWSGTMDNTAVITLGVFMAAAYKIIPGIVKILNTSGQVNTYAFTVDELALRKGPGGERQTLVSMPSIPAAPSMPSIRTIRFKDIVFSYNGHVIVNKPALQLSPGDFLGISGSSGKGKTTILNLLLGFLTPQQGDILINDTIADTATRQQYWRNISYVKQQPFLIHDSIRYNITLGGEPFDKEKLQAAVLAAGLSQLIDSFPGKWDKVIAENGKNISGGQRQRIAIARALYKQADLVILDEPFNELDEASEIALLNHFQELAREGKLIILITHNKKSLSYCNKIISLDE